MSYFEIKKQSTLQEISTEMNKLLLNLEDLNVYLKDSVTLGDQFKNISSLWNTFYSFENQSKQLRKDVDDKKTEDVEQQEVLSKDQSPAENQDAFNFTKDENKDGKETEIE